MNKTSPKTFSKTLQFVRFQRYQLINAIYLQELQNQPLNSQDFDRLLIKHHKTKKQLFDIIRNYERFKKQICLFLEKGYQWELNFALLRAILIVGAYLLYKMDHGIVINELVEFTKLYVPGNYFRFVNKILDSLAKKHVFHKQQSQSAELIT